MRDGLKLIVDDIRLGNGRTWPRMRAQDEAQLDRALGTILTTAKCALGEAYGLDLGGLTYPHTAAHIETIRSTGELPQDWVVDRLNLLERWRGRVDPVSRAIARAVCFEGVSVRSIANRYHVRHSSVYDPLRYALDAWLEITGRIPDDGRPRKITFSGERPSGILRGC
jgi:hypothetical protein